jgi:circadian clock protein KaiC
MPPSARKQVQPGISPPRAPQELAKAPSGIAGLDEITGGGLPRGRPTLICGGPGSGKTLFALEFLVRGILDYGEPGVFMSFEESAEELAANVASLGFDLRELEAQNMLAIDYVRVERYEIEETGDYDLEGLFVRLQLAIETVGARRVVLDTIESLFSGLPNLAILRSELRRLFRWLKDRGQTVVLTGEKGEGSLTRQGLEEYVSDCVIFLDHRVIQQISTRRLRVVKYRGSIHGTNEYPFLIDEGGIAVLPVTSLGLEHEASTERVSSGIPRLDEMLGGEGYYRGSTVLASGTAGTGKTTLAAALVGSACGRGERCLFLSYEESAEQLVRNMSSVGIDLASFREDGSLRVVATRPMAHGLEMHLVALHKLIEAFEPDIVAIDPITSLVGMGTASESQAMMIRLIDYLKSRGITAFLTSLTAGGETVERSEAEISSLVDTWLLLGVVRSGGERNRTLAIIKSRGMAHSNQASEFVISSGGLQLLDTYLGPGGALTGAARIAREAEETTAAEEAAAELARKQQRRESLRRLVEAKIAALRDELAAEDAELEREVRQDARRVERMRAVRETLARARHSFTPSSDREQKGRS